MYNLKEVFLIKYVDCKKNSPEQILVTLLIFCWSETVRHYHGKFLNRFTEVIALSNTQETFKNNFLVIETWIQKINNVSDFKNKFSSGRLF